MQDKRKWIHNTGVKTEEAAGTVQIKVVSVLNNDKLKTANAVKDKSGNMLT